MLHIRNMLRLCFNSVNGLHATHRCGEGEVLLITCIWHRLVSIGVAMRHNEVIFHETDHK